MTMTPLEISRVTETLCRKAPVIPVLVIEDATHAAPLAALTAAANLGQGDVARVALQFLARERPLRLRHHAREVLFNDETHTCY